MSRPVDQRRARQAGAALIESALVVALMSLVLFGALQVSRLYAAREILDYAAMNGARARAVGLNSFMVYKVVRVSAIPNAGRMRGPHIPVETETSWWEPGQRPGEAWDRALRSRPGLSPRAVLERHRIPFYLGATHHARLAAILDYEDWDTIRSQIDYPAADQIRVHVNQRWPANMPFRRAFMDTDYVPLRAVDHGVRMTDHSALYLQ